jgi:hypothetical protein
MLDEGEAAQFSADLDRLIAESRPKNTTRRSMLTLQQKAAASSPRLGTEQGDMSDQMSMFEDSMDSSYVLDQMSSPSVYAPQAASSNHYSPYNSNMTWRAHGMLQISKTSRSAGKLPIPGHPPGKGKKSVPTSQNKCGKTYKATPGNQTAKCLTPNQLYGRVVKEYADNRSKMAKLEQFLQSLPSEKSDLHGTMYARSDPYMQLFIYQRLTRPGHRGRQSYEEVRRTYLRMRLKLEVEVHPSLFQNLLDAGVPLSDTNAAKLQAWLDGNQAKHGVRVANKTSTDEAHDGGEAPSRPCELCKGAHWRWDCPETANAADALDLFRRLASRGDEQGFAGIAGQDGQIVGLGTQQASWPTPNRDDFGNKMLSTAACLGIPASMRYSWCSDLVGVFGVELSNPGYWPAGFRRNGQFGEGALRENVS